MSIVVTHLPELGITAVSSWVFNCYVVHDAGAGRPMLVDPGVPSVTRRALELITLRGTAAVVVVATHGHADHVGGLGAIDPADSTLALPDRIRSFLDGETPRSPALGEIARIRPVLRDQPFSLRPILEVARTRRHTGVDGRGARLPRPADQWLADSDVVDGAPDWQVIHTPGHTDDSTSLWNPTTGVLLSGDAVLSVQGRAWFTPELVDRDLAAATEERLRPLAVRALLPGHGRPVLGRSVMRHALGPDDAVRR